MCLSVRPPDADTSLAGGQGPARVEESSTEDIEQRAPPQQLGAHCTPSAHTHTGSCTAATTITPAAHQMEALNV